MKYLRTVTRQKLLQVSQSKGHNRRKNHQCRDKTGRQNLLSLGEYKQADILSYSMFLFSASKEHWCLQRGMDAAARAHSAPTEATGLSAQSLSLPGASGKPEPSLFCSYGTVPIVSMKHEAFPIQDLTSLKIITRNPMYVACMLLPGKQQKQYFLSIKIYFWHYAYNSLERSPAGAELLLLHLQLCTAAHSNYLFWEHRFLMPHKTHLAAGRSDKTFNLYKEGKGTR